jgi:pyridinium-3,5-bisthiocarboxylic acid mononucleotide nickel chelatase
VQHSRPRGIPIAASQVEAELTTPTGAAILAALAESFGPPPAMTVERIGYGAGSRDFETHPNLLRILVGTPANPSTAGDRSAIGKLATETLTLLETNLDDISGEVVGHCTAKLLLTGALDVFTTSIQMKKNRPGVMLSVLCQPSDAAKLETILFQETTTLGVRQTTVIRSKLARTKQTVITAWGPIDGVLAILPNGQQRFSPEYESCRAAAEQHHVPLQNVFNAAHAAFGH